VELQEDPLGPQRRALEVVDAQRGGLLARVLGQVARDEPLVAAPPAAPGVVGQPDARR
jgi:hypothetical protein